MRFVARPGVASQPPGAARLPVSVDAGAQVWLPSGSYTVDVQLFALGRHRVPLVVEPGSGQRPVEVFVDT